VKIYLGLFLVGLSFGIGPCLIFCGPVIFAYVAGAKKGWREGLNSGLLFLTSRLVSYLALGALGGISGKWLGEFFYEKKFGDYLWILAGVFILILGIAIGLGKDFDSYFCRITHRSSAKNINVILLGLLMGLAPCAPLIGVLVYITLSSKGVLDGIFYAFFFGIGTMVSPLIGLCVLSGLIPHFLSGRPKILSYFKRACGFFLSLLGIHLIISRLLSIY